MPGVVRVLWDIENMPLHPTQLKQALTGYLRADKRLLPGDRMEMTAYHDPRRVGGLAEEAVDTIVVNNIVLVDKGSKKGFADHCLARDARNIASDVTSAGLRVHAVVVISSDSDFSASGVYDALNDADVSVIVVHGDAIKNALLMTASWRRIFVHSDDLSRYLPAGPAVVPAPSAQPAAPIATLTSRLARTAMSSPSSPLLLMPPPQPQPPVTSPHQARGLASASQLSFARTPAGELAGAGAGASAGEGEGAGGGAMGFLPHEDDDAVSLVLSEAPLPDAESNKSRVKQRIVMLVLEQPNFWISGAALGVGLRKYFTYKKLKPLLEECTLSPYDGLSLVIDHPASLGGDIRISARRLDPATAAVPE